MNIVIQNAHIAATNEPQSDGGIDLTIVNGIISAVSPTVIEDKHHSRIEVDGKPVWDDLFNNRLYISEGWVDMFAHYGEPGYESKSTIAIGKQESAAGGFTHVALLPNTKPAIANRSMVEYINKAAQGGVVVCYPMGCVGRDGLEKEPAEMIDMHYGGAIAFTNGTKPIQNSQLLLKALEYVKVFNGLIVQMPIDDALSAGGLMHEGELSTRLGLSGIPAIAETVMLQRDIALLRYTGSRLHITGISTAEGCQIVKDAKAEGLDISCSVTPYHLTLTEEALKSYDSIYKVNPPLRSETDRQALIAALADGTIDAIATHHLPQHTDAKNIELEYAEPGMALQSSAFNVLWGALQQFVPLHRLIDALTIMPRQLLKLPCYPVEEGQKACLTLFTTGCFTQLSRYQLPSLHVNNPYVNTLLPGKVIGVINNNSSYFNKI